MTPDFPALQDVVLIGGGHTHALLLRKWGMSPLAGARLTLINPGPAAPYTGMLPGFVAGHYSRGELDIDLVALARHAGARLLLDRAVNIDLVRREVILAGREPVAFDTASIDIGITSGLAQAHGNSDAPNPFTPVKPLEAFADRWETFLQRDATGRDIAVAGGGAGGVELALAMAYRLKTSGRSAQITLIEAGDTVLSDLAPGQRDRLTRALEAYDVCVRTGTVIRSARDSVLALSDGSTLRADLLLDASGPAPYDWLANTPFALKDGYIRTDAQLRTVTDTCVFAVGDCAHFDPAPHAKAGVYAVRQVPVLYENLRRTLRGVTGLKRFDPQTDYLKLISMGGKSAVGGRFGMSLSGPLVWQAKNLIDRRFMRRLSDLPAMEGAPLPDEHVEGLADAHDPARSECGGCGSKLGSVALETGLGALPPARRGDVETGRGDDGAVLSVGGARQVLSTDHLRAFCDDPYLMAKVAAHHALSDIWAMGADPQAALSSIILPPLSPALQARTFSEIMTAAGHVFSEAGADLVGGHTSSGAELTIGFTVTGLLTGEASRMSGARPGDRLILTKPIGTGAVLAGSMQGRANGRDVACVWEAMASGNGAASAVLRHHASAMTDVTGFGLAGHALRMAKASGVRMQIEMAAVPLLAGALDMARAGVRSSIFAANLSACGRVDGYYGPGVKPAADLLFDPQTSGGLLASVPAERAAQVCNELEAGDVRAAIIGWVDHGAPGLVVS